MSNTITQTSSFNQKLIDEMSDRNILQDRLPGDKLTLPYDMNSISISVNDLVMAETINYSLDQLYGNWIYLISTSIIPSNNIPNSELYTSIVVDTPSTGLNWVNSTEFPNISSNSTSNALSGIRNITKITNTVNSNNYNIIATTSTNIILLSGTGDTSIDVIVNSQNPQNIIRSDSSIAHPSNGINFQSIVNHTVNDSNELFVLDDSLKSVFKFDISGILTLDKAILNNDTPGRLMTEMVGSPGNIMDKNRFYHPTAITTVDDLIHVLDFHSPEAAIKSFDSQLNWKDTTSLGSTVSSGPIDMAYNSSTRRHYILCHYTSYGGPPAPPELVILDHMFNYIETVKLMDENRHNTNIMSEVFKSIYFSIENPNILYIVTGDNIYKKYVSRPTEFIGKFRLGEKSIGTGYAGDMKFEDISITSEVLASGDDNILKDDILLYESEYEVIHNFKEDSAYEQSLENQFDDKILYITDLVINPEESVNTFVYNKTFMKHLYNNILMLESTSRKFTTTYDTSGISQYIGFQYLNISELSTLKYTPGMNNYIGVNEIVTTHTINRCLEEIYSLQQTLISNMQEKSTNVYPLVNQPVILTTIS